MSKRLGLEQCLEHVSTRAAREIASDRFPAQEADRARNIKSAAAGIAPRDPAAQLVIGKDLRYGRGDIDRGIYRQRHDALHAFLEDQLFIS